MNKLPVLEDINKGSERQLKTRNTETPLGLWKPSKLWAFSLETGSSLPTWSLGIQQSSTLNWNDCWHNCCIHPINLFKSLSPQYSNWEAISTPCQDAGYTTEMEIGIPIWRYQEYFIFAVRINLISLKEVMISAD